MDPFFYRCGGKNLPGKQGQQDLIAASFACGKTLKSLS
jgi:hypothetical protein